MGLFSSKKSSTAYTTNNIDESINLADSTLTQVGENALLAEEVGSYNRDSNNINIAGANNVVEQFSDNVKEVVSDALRLSESVTSKNLQLQTDKDLLSMELQQEKGITWNDVQDLVKSRNFQIVAASVAGLVVILTLRKKK